MTDKVRKELDVLDLLMQDHREVESMFREFEHLQQSGQDAGAVIASACAELRMQDTLETEVFYAAVDEATDDETIQELLDEAEDEHDTILGLMERLEQAGTDHKQRDDYFTTLVEQMKHHVLAEETELFPLVKGLKALDLDAVTAAMKKRKAELIADMGITEDDEATV